MRSRMPDSGLTRSLATYYPASHCIFFDHSYAELQQASERLFGRAMSDPDYMEAADIDWRKGVVFDDVLRYTTYLHEVAHVRHLSASPLGLALWVLSGIERGKNARCLRNWGEGAGMPRNVTLPLLSHGSSDPWLQEIARRRKQRHALEVGLLRPAPGSDLLDWLYPLQLFFDELRPFCEDVLKQDHYGASVVIPANMPRDLSPSNFAGEAVIEGLARCNESIALIQLGAPRDILNRHMFAKQGSYVIGFIGQGLGVSDAGKLVFVCAALLDWALQAPLLSFLLAEREWIEMHELLPAWRLVRLVARFANSRFTVKDVLKRHDKVERELFSQLGWTSPTELGNRLLGLDIPTSAPVGTRLAVRKLRLGAQIRARHPMALAYPLVAPGDEAFRAAIATFTDRRVVYLGDVDKRTEDASALLVSFLDDLIHDALLGDEDVGRARLLADTLSQQVGGFPTGSEIFRTRLRAMVRDAADEMLIAWHRSDAYEKN
jgi:hypothetical protein